MALDKLTITTDPTDGNKTIEVMYNPERITINKSVQIAEITIPGLDSPVQQFVRGQTEKISFELFFDTTTFGMLDDVKDVREFTGQIYDLLRIRSHTHAPPRCRLTWGKGGGLIGRGQTETNEKPRCLLESVSEEFTLFSPGGVPLRAKLNVTFREAWTIDEQLRDIGKRSATFTKLRTLAPKQSLSQLAWQEYGDPAQWRAIAEEPANHIDNPRTVAPGSELEVPRLTGRPR